MFFDVSEAMVQLTISLNLIGITLSGLIYGPLSDIYGRRPVILVRLALFGGCGAGGIALEGYWHDATILPLAIIATVGSSAALLVSLSLAKLAPSVRLGELKEEAVVK